MARKLTLDYLDEDYQIFIKNFKMFLGVETDKDMAEIMGLTTSGYSHFKRTNTFPFDKVVRVALEKNLSLDEIFNNENAKKISNLSDIKDDIFQLINKNTYIKLPFFRQNSEYSLRAFIDGVNIYIVDTGENEVNNSDLLLKSNSDYYVKNVRKEIEGTYLVSNHSRVESCSDSTLSLTKSEFEKFTIVGTIVAQASVRTW